MGRWFGRETVKEFNLFAKKVIFGLAIRFFVALFVASYPILSIDTLHSNISPAEIVFIRFTTAALLFSPAIFAYRKIIDYRILLTASLLGFTHAFLMSYASLSGLLLSTPDRSLLLGPATVGFWAMIFGYILFQLRYSRFEIMAACTIFIGFVGLIVANSDPNNPFKSIWGDALFLIAGMLGGFSSSIVQKTKIPLFLLIALVSLFGATYASTFNLLTGDNFSIFQYIEYEKKSILVHGVFMGTVVNLGIYGSIKMCGMVKASAIDSLVPCLALFISIYYMETEYRYISLLFSIIICTGVAMIAMAKSKGER